MNLAKRIHFTRGGIAGLVGTAMMNTLTAAARRKALAPVDFTGAQASMINPTRPGASRKMGLAMTLFNGVLFGIGYGALFEKQGKAGWKQGLIISLPHALAAGAGAMLSPSKARRKLLPRHQPIRAGITLALAHMLFGVVVGEIYRWRGKRRS